MKQIFQTSQFKKDIKRLTKRGKNLTKLSIVVKDLAEGKILEEKYRDHALSGVWIGSRDCHVEPDWILIYRPEPDALFLERSGSHSDLFK
jgi:mRNA interferase YafQ